MISLDDQFYLDGDECRAFNGVVGNKILQRDQLLSSVDDLDNSPIYSLLCEKLSTNPSTDFQFFSAAQDVRNGHGPGSDITDVDLQNFQDSTSGCPSDKETIEFLLKMNQNLTFENIELRNRLHYCYFCGNCSSI